MPEAFRRAIHQAKFMNYLIKNYGHAILLLVAVFPPPKVGHIYAYFSKYS